MRLFLPWQRQTVPKIVIRRTISLDNHEITREVEISGDAANDRLYVDRERRWVDGGSIDDE